MKHHHHFACALLCILACGAYKSPVSPLITGDGRLIKSVSVPRLILISGATGTGKSSLAMALAQADNCTKCVSTDTIREIARYYSHSADVHRPSYVGDRHPIVDWRASVDALHGPILSVLDHALVRGISAIVEGVALDPSNELIARWRSAGGTAFGVLVKISEENKHLDAIRLRGYHKQLTHFSRIRRIQEEMISIAETSKDHWLQLEQTDVQAMVAEIIDHMKSRNNQ